MGCPRHRTQQRRMIRPASAPPSATHGRHRYQRSCALLLVLPLVCQSAIALLSAIRLFQKLFSEYSERCDACRDTAIHGYVLDESDKLVRRDSVVHCTNEVERELAPSSERRGYGEGDQTPLP